MPDPIPGQEPTTPVAPVTPPVAPITPTEPEDELVKLITADPKRTADEIRALRHEAAENRKKAGDAEQKRKDEEAAKLAEQGKYKELAEQRDAELAELRASLKEDKIKAAVLLEATKAHIVDPEAAYVLADLSKTDVSETGIVAGVTEAIAALVKEKPYLIAPATAPAMPAAPNIRPTNPGGGPALTPDGLRKMSAADIAAIGADELRAALSGKP